MADNGVITVPTRATPSSPAVGKVNLYANSDKMMTAIDENGDIHILNNNGINLITNSGFQINQRVYVSSATLASGEFGHDRWKAGASGGDYTFSQLTSFTAITVEAGKSLIYVVEDKDVEGGDYVLSWEGTAQARAGVNSDTPSGAYADSPLEIPSQSAGTTMSVEFDEGTLGKVKLEIGSAATPFRTRGAGFEEELALCQHFCVQYTATGNTGMCNGGLETTTNFRGVFILPVLMRPHPTVSVKTIGNWNVQSEGSNHTASAIGIIRTLGDKVWLTVTNAAATQGYAGVFNTDTAGEWIRFTSEL